MEFMQEGIMTTIIGMGVVFTVLILLSFFIRMLNAGVNAVDKKRDQAVQTGEPVAEAVNVSAPVAVIKPAMGISAAKVAAITAAICAMTGKEADEFRFTAIRPAAGNGPQSMWAVLGTADLISNRQKFTERGNR